jgi:hypothetical protein
MKMMMTMIMSTRMTSTRTTTRFPSWPREHGRGELQRKAVRIHQLTDPLGAIGFRQTRSRLEREGKARRLAAFGAMASFAASLALIIWNVPQSAPELGGSAFQKTTSLEPVSAKSAPVTSVGTGNLGARLPGAAAFDPTAVPHTRTRSS